MSTVNKFLDSAFSLTSTLRIQDTLTFFGLLSLKCFKLMDYTWSTSRTAVPTRSPTWTDAPLGQAWFEKGALLQRVRHGKV